MKKGGQSNKLIVLNHEYIIVLGIQNAGLGIVSVLLDIQRYHKNNCTQLKHVCLAANVGQ